MTPFSDTISFRRGRKIHWPLTLYHPACTLNLFPPHHSSVIWYYITLVMLHICITLQRTSLTTLQKIFPEVHNWIRKRFTWITNIFQYFWLDLQVNMCIVFLVNIICKGGHDYQEPIVCYLKRGFCLSDLILLFWTLLCCPFSPIVILTKGSKLVSI